MPERFERHLEEALKAWTRTQQGEALDTSAAVENVTGMSEERQIEFATRIVSDEVAAVERLAAEHQLGPLTAKLAGIFMTGLVFGVLAERRRYSVEELAHRN